MAIKTTHNEKIFSVGDVVKIYQIIEEGEKKRNQIFEGTVIGIKGEGENKSFTVRRIGVNQIGIEKIFPLSSPIISKIEISHKGGKGVRRAKLYYIREKSKKEIDKIYTRTKRKETIQGKVKIKKSSK